MMEEDSHTNNSSSGADKGCLEEEGYLVSLALINVFTFIIGQPVTARLLWITFTARKSIDILNCNLALFYNFLYLAYMLHLIFLFVFQQQQSDLLNSLLIYSQVGGSMGLCFICMERYVAVIYPTSYPLLRKYRWREVCVGTVWLSCLSTFTLNTLAKDNISSLIQKMIKNIPPSVMLLMTVLMACCTVRMVRVLMKSSPGRDRLHPAKRKAFRIIWATTAINLLFYIPVALVQKLNQDEIWSQCTLTPVLLLILSAASVVHPMFYLSTKGELFPCLKRRI